MARPAAGGNITAVEAASISSSSFARLSSAVKHTPSGSRLDSTYKEVCSLIVYDIIQNIIYFHQFGRGRGVHMAKPVEMYVGSRGECGRYCSASAINRSSPGAVKWDGAPLERVRGERGGEREEEAPALRGQCHADKRQLHRRPRSHSRLSRLPSLRIAVTIAFPAACLLVIVIAFHYGGAPRRRGRPSRSRPRGRR